MELNKVYCGKMEDVLVDFTEDAIDSIVTDPPYGLNFMGKKWDYDVPSVTQWEEAYRVLKPGGYMLVACGTRTQHRMVVNIEDAGFEIRDVITWHYGSGFPKSLDISKAIDKQGGESLSWFIDYILKVADEKNISRKELTMLFPSKNGNPTGWLWNKQKTQGITCEQFNVIKAFLKLPFEDIEEAEREVIGQGKAGLTKGTIANFAGKTEFDITAPETDGAKEWEGWGTALKPATEFWTLCRKPISENTVAENVLKHGTGGINIDACRIGLQDCDNKDLRGINRNIREGEDGWGMQDNKADIVQVLKENGRFPANLILDEFMAAELDKQSGILTSGNVSPEGFKGEYTGTIYGKFKNNQIPSGSLYGDSGGASRFFYVAKPSPEERNKGLRMSNAKFMDESRKEGSIGGSNPRNRGAEFKRNNFHPTVKPIELMRYLVKMVTPKGGTCLDSFCGSGSTLIACKLEEINYIGIDKEQEYCEMAEARIKAWPLQKDLFNL